MVFNSIQFALFFAVVYGVYRASGHRAQNWLLLAASYAFYAAWDWRFTGLLAASTLVAYVAALRMHHEAEPRRRRWLWLGVGFHLLALGFFKYYGFFAENLGALLAASGMRVPMPLLTLVLPLGISFYTFMAIAYLVDVYRGDIAPTGSLADFALFISYFPHLIAGPILRAPALIPQIAQPRVIGRREVSEGLWLTALGLFKKMFVADNLAPIVDAVFAPGHAASGLEVLLGVYAFALQIYGDFSGYSDMARGLSQLMGIELNVNFRFPYFVRTPREFWRHWHISLSTWLRDYLFIPLGGSRGTRAATNRNLVVTMVLGGLWHGAAWTFVAWGAYQGFLLIVHRELEARVGRWWPTGRRRLAAVIGVDRDDPPDVLWVAAVPGRLDEPGRLDVSESAGRSGLDAGRRRARDGARRLRAAARPGEWLRVVEGRPAGHPGAAARPALRGLRGALLPDARVRPVRRRAIHLLPVLGRDGSPV